MAKKYIDAELIHQEIERRIGGIIVRQNAELNMPEYIWYLYEGMKEAFVDTDDFIDSIVEQEQSRDMAIDLDVIFSNMKRNEAIKQLEHLNKVYGEQPSEDLKSEMEKYFQGLWPGAETAEQCNTDMHFTPPAIMRLTRHFYELGKQSKEPTNEDLENAAIDYADYARKQPKDYAISSVADYDHGCIDGFIAGAEWQKSQIPMPEDTVIFQKGIEEGKRLMMEDAVEGYVNYYEDGGGKLMAEAQVGCPYHIGDKVKIIIVPNEN